MPTESRLLQERATKVYCCMTFQGQRGGRSSPCGLACHVPTESRLLQERATKVYCCMTSRGQRGGRSSPCGLACHVPTESRLLQERVTKVYCYMIFQGQRGGRSSPCGLACHVPTESRLLQERVTKVYSYMMAATLCSDSLVFFRATSPLEFVVYSQYSISADWNREDTVCNMVHVDGFCHGNCCCIIPFRGEMNCWKLFCCKVQWLSTFLERLYFGSDSGESAVMGGCTDNILGWHLRGDAQFECHTLVLGVTWQRGGGSSNFSTWNFRHAPSAPDGFSIGGFAVQQRPPSFGPAELCVALYRQNLLLASGFRFPFVGVFSVSFSDSGFSLSDSLSKELNDGNCGQACSWIRLLRLQLETWLLCCLSEAAAWTVMVLLLLGDWALAVCRTGCLVVLCFLGRTLLFGGRLKGGRCNYDNLLRLGRSLTAAAPWHLADGICTFSPRIMDGMATHKERSGQRRCYSYDLFLLVCLASALLGTADAANVQRPPAQPPEFPRPPVFPGDRDADRGLLQDPDVATDLDPNQWVFQLPQLPQRVFVSRAYKLFGYGHQPEFLSSTTVHDVPLRRCLDLLVPDANVAHTGGSGALYPLRGPAVVDELQVQWIPSWVHHALGRLVIIDPSLLGWTPFQAYIRDGIISYDRIHRIMPELVNSEFYIFIPSQAEDPLSFAGYPSRIIVDHGDVVHLTPDPAPPQAMLDFQWGFDNFSTWSLSAFMDGYDRPDGGTRVLVLSANGHFLMMAIPGEQDLDLVQRICADLEIAAQGVSIVRPTEPFDRPMYCQHILSDIIYLVETPLVEPEIIVFVDARPVLQTFSGVRLSQPAVPVSEAVDIFGLRVEAIDGYRLWLKGGRKRHDHLLAEHCGKFWVRLEEQAFEFTSDSGSDGSGGDQDDHNAGPEPESTGSDGADTIIGSATSLSSSSSPERGSATGDGAETRDISRDRHEDTLRQQRVSMWNYAFGQDAHTQGKHGDTSGQALSCCSTLRSFGLKRPLPEQDDGLGLTDVRPAKRQGGVAVQHRLGGATSGIRLYLAGLALLHSFTIGGTVGTSCSPAGVVDQSLHGLLLAETPRCVLPIQCDLEDGCYSSSSQWLPWDFKPASALDDGTELEELQLITLLEEAKDDSLGPLCEALAWFLSRSPRHPPTASSDGCGGVGRSATISLATALGFRQVDTPLHTSQSNFCPIPLSWLPHPDLFHEWADFSLFKDPADLLDCELHDNSRWALQWACQSFPHLQPGWDLHLYTDGSALEERAGWAVVIVANNPGGGVCELIGCFGGTLGGEDDLGTTLPDALQAEQVALCWALLWTLPQIDMLADYFEGLFFCWDCVTAGAGASGDCKLTSTALARPLRGLYKLVDQLSRGRVAGRHIKAHEGHPWNELADSLANAFRRGKRGRGDLSKVARAFRQVNWDWAPVIIDDGFPCLTVQPEAAVCYNVGHHSGGNLPETIIPIQPCASAGKSVMGAGSQPSCFDLTVISANLQGINGKHRYLEAQFCDGEADFAFLQETKSKGGSFSSASYHRFASEHDGHWGTAVWIRRFIKLNGSSVAVHPSDCRVLVCNPRIIAVSLKIAGSTFLLISAHLPQQSHGHEGRNVIFDCIRQAVGRVRHSAAVFLGIDANARVPCGFDSVTGDIEFGEADAYGFKLVEVLSELGLWIPATFSEHHVGSSATVLAGSLVLTSCVWVEAFDHVIFQRGLQLI